MGTTRRAVLAGGLTGLGACGTVRVPGVLSGKDAASFGQGVASGDPQTESVVIWTRAAAAGTVRGTAEVAEDEGFSRVAWSAPFEAGPGTDHTVKLVADGLAPGGRYHYRFRVGETASPTGRTRTLPERAERARFAVMSCSNYPFGYFNAYDHAARQDLDAVIHLGDMVYEYGPDGYGGEVGARLGRAHVPARETVSLTDYRLRHRQYKTDPASRAMHAAHPLIAVWDDHETANDSWKGGAQNHGPGEGGWAARRRAAMQAYYEYVPVRNPRPGEGREAFWRSFTWGGLLTLAAIETRLTARTEQLAYERVLPELTSPEAVERWRREVLEDGGREMMGAEQATYVAQALAGSAARGEPWRLLANQVIMARVTAPDLAAAITEAEVARIEREWPPIRDYVAFAALGLPTNLDAWDGYPAARERFYQAARDAGARDLVVLTGDTHEAWANRLTDADGQPMGVEIGATGVTSPGSAAYLGERAEAFARLLAETNEDVVWQGVGVNGYVDLTLDHEGGRADHVAVSTVLSEDYEARVVRSFALVRRDGTVTFEGA